MNERDFYYWLRGFFELTDAEKLDKQQVKMIKEHMDLVAKKVTDTTSIFNTPLTPTIVDPPAKPSSTLDWRQTPRSVFNPDDVRNVLLSSTRHTTDTNIKNHLTC